MAEDTQGDGEVLVAIDYHPAYRLLIVNPQPGAPGAVMPLTRLLQSVEEYLGPLKCTSPTTSEEAYQQFLELALGMPGIPLGLTFDGGIAVTATDYHLAEQRWRSPITG